MKNKEAEEGGYEVLFPAVQDFYRELPVIDICIRLLYNYVIYDLRNPSYKRYNTFLNKVIAFLVKVCKNNKLNCFYLFQFFSLYV